MGQIIIDVPNDKVIHFEISDKKEYKDLMHLLEEFCTLENPDLSDEDLDDIACANQALAKGNFITLAEAESFWDR